MKRIAAVAFVLSLAAAPAAFAGQTKMSEAQLDQVTGGLADVSVNLTDVANPTITVNPTTTVSPTITISVLGGGAGL